MKIIGKLLVIIILLRGLVFAGTTGKISGHISDSKTGEALVGANIIIEGSTLGAAADLNGDYYIINVTPGIYKLKVTMIGYADEIIEGVRVNSDHTTIINAQLTTKELTQKEIVVTANKRIQKDLTSSERSIQADQIINLPARDLNSILTLESGITQDASGGLHIRGGRSSEISYMIDGVQVMDPLNRTNGISIDDQSYQEVQAITGTFNAEYGQALSGVINIVTKKGSDHFTANASVYMGNFFSTDNLYSVMTNRDWADAVAMSSVVNFNNPLRYYYDFSKYGMTYSQALRAASNGYKPWLTSAKYLNKFKPLVNDDYQLNLSGPIIGTNKHVTYYLAGRDQKGNGSTYGMNYFEPWGLWAPAMDTIHQFTMPNGDLTPLYTYENISAQGKVYYNDQNLQLSYGVYYNNDQNYNAQGKYNPAGGLYNYNNTDVQILNGTYVFSNSTFLDMHADRYDKNYKTYAYANPYDSRYVPTNTGDWQQYIFNPSPEGSVYSVTNLTDDYGFYGNNPYRSNEHTAYNELKFSLTSQINKFNLVKLGGSGKWYNLAYENYNLQFDQTNYRPFVPPDTSTYHTSYTAMPKQFAAYIQDKIEFNELIINIGVRFDYFNSEGRILTDPRDPEIYDPALLSHLYSNYTPTTAQDSLSAYTIAQRSQFWYKKADAKYSLSPRFGLSFPITADGVIHFSYGHFFQVPEFQYLYTNPNFWVTGAGATPLVGNANLNPEESVMYEIGLQQKLFSNLFINITGFYRDIRDWIGTGNPQLTYTGQTYYQYVNKDNAVAKGITFSASYSLENFSAHLDYTYMSALGTNSNPTDAFIAQQNGQAPIVQLIDLSWEQPQVLNIQLNYNKSGWSSTLTTQFASGYPYTPTVYSNEATGSAASYSGFIENSARMPSSLNFNLQVSKAFQIGNVNLVAVCNIQNLFDTRNVLGVYSDTGLPNTTSQASIDETRILELASSQEYFNNPGNVSSPRYIQFGLRIGL